ncbi:MAG: hypothetical protein JW718_06965 [Desulfovibrionaceae bacterium]|nr:hypothetical protein [Desulfovibrionaceae bacterium]
MKKQHGLFWILVLVLAFALPALAGWGEIREADRDLNVRRARDLGSEHVKTLKKGDRVKVDFLEDGWVAVFALDEPVRSESRAIGYSNAKYLLPAAGSAPVASAAPQAPEVRPEVRPAAGPKPGSDDYRYVSGEIKYADRQVQIRKARSEDSAATATLSPGEHIQVGFLKDGWYAVFRMNDAVKSEADAVGYVPASALQPRTLEQLAGSGAARPEARFSIQAQAPVLAAPPEPKKVLATAAPEVKIVPEVKAKVVEPAVPLPAAKVQAKEAIRITSDKMTYSDVASTVTFSGNVQATHSGLSLWADSLSALFSGNTQGTENTMERIESITAKGKVRMKIEGTEGSCDKAAYFVKDGVLRMEGDPQIREGQNVVKGEVIKFYVKDRRSEVLGGKASRVEAVFFSPKGLKP